MIPVAHQRPGSGEDLPGAGRSALQTDSQKHIGGFSN